MLWRSTPDAFKKLDPRVQIKNPVMFVVEVGALLCMYTAIRSPSVFNWTIVVWLWLTVVFANLAEAVAEGRGKAQAETLRRAKRETMARRLANWQPGADPASLREESVPGTALHARRPRGGRGGRGHPRRRGRGRGRGLGGRVGHHRRVRAGYPGVRRRPVRGHRRHHGAVGPDRGEDHLQAGRDVHRPDDRPGRGGASGRRRRTRSR